MPPESLFFLFPVEGGARALLPISSVLGPRHLENEDLESAKAFEENTKTRKSKGNM